MATNTPQDVDGIKIAVYSDDRTVRQQIVLALGRKVAADLPELMINEYATAPALFAALDQAQPDVVVLDGEATPLGGVGVARQMKDEYTHPAPVVVLLARQADAWLAAWSNAEAISPYPVDPVRLPRTVADVLRAARSHASTDLQPETSPQPGMSSRHAADED